MTSATWPEERPARAVQRPRRRMDLLDAFILVQYISTALLFLPGSQALRIPIRTLPYFASLGVSLHYRGTSRASIRTPGVTPLLLALGLITISLLHPDTQPVSGIAQVLLQVCIAAPMFGLARAVGDSERLERMLMLVLAANALGAVVGLLQVFYPDVFLPREFSAAAMASSPNLLDAMSYIGTNGQRIVRPPGLSDLPGGAGVAGAVSALFGVALMTREGQTVGRRAVYLGCAAIGLATLFFTQIRSLMIVTLAAVVIFGILSARRGRPGALLGSVGLGSLVVVAVFTFAVSVGGDAIENRFLGVVDQGLVSSYQTNRGGFLKEALTETSMQYPFGAGVGRWGVMFLYFGDPNILHAKQIWAEIQLTGWLLDGGLLMWLFYGSAIFLALRFAYRLALRSRDEALAHQAALVFSSLFIIAAQSFAGPAFNTQLGVQFWTLTAALWGASTGWASSRSAARAAAVR